MEDFNNLNIHDIRILRLIALQAKEARKTDGIDDEFTQYRRLCFTHIEYAISELINLMEEGNEIF